MGADFFFDVYIFTSDDKIVHSINLSDNGNLPQLLYEGEIYEINTIDFSKSLTEQEWSTIKLVPSEEVEVSFSKIEDAGTILQIFQKIAKFLYSANYLTTTFQSLSVDNLSDSKKANLLRTHFSFAESIGVINGVLMTAKAHKYKVQFASGPW